jgi:arsenate reductase
MNKVIFACVHNAGRSQMAAAFFNQLANPKVSWTERVDGMFPLIRLSPTEVSSRPEGVKKLPNVHIQLLLRMH